MRLLFITSTRIGDAVLSSGLLSHLVENSSSPVVTVACGPEAAPVFENLPGLNNLIIMEKRPGGRHWASLWSKCVTKKWDIVVDLRSSAIAWALPTSNRLILKRSKKTLHKVVEIGALCNSINPPDPKLWISKHHLLAANDVLPDTQFIVIAPTANWLGKQWRGKNFGELARRLTSKQGILPGASIVVLGGKNERNQAQDMFDSVQGLPVVDLVGKLKLMVAAAIIKRAKFFVGNDSALMHISAASGTPTLGLFGPSREANYAPWGKKCAVQRTKLSYDELTGTPNYDHRKTGTLMDSLTVDMAEIAAQSLWRKLAER